MKTASTWIFFGVMAVGLIYAHGRAYGQSENAPIVTGGEDKPWNKGVPAETREAARAVFLEGNRLFRVPLFAQAAEKYTAALSQWKHPGFYFNLALAQLNLGQEVEARENLEKALEHGEEPLGAEQFAEAKKQLQQVEHLLGRIRINCQTKGAEVTLDGMTLFIGPGSYQGWSKAKSHEITAKAPGYLSEARRVTVSPGQMQDIELKLVTVSEAADSGRRWATWKPWSVVVAGAAIGAGGAVLHALSSRNFNDYDAKFLQLDCAKDTGCTQAETGSKLNAQLRLATREQKVAVGGYIAGGSMIAAGVVLLYLNRPRLLEQGAPNSPARRVAIVPTVSGDMLGILVSVNQ